MSSDFKHISRLLISWTKLYFMLLVILIGFASNSNAQQNNAFWKDTERGERLLRRHCARCHIVGLAGKPTPNSAPMFRNLSKTISMDNLANSLSDGVLTGHPKMPNFYFTSKEVDVIMAYLRSIQAQ